MTVLREAQIKDSKKNDWLPWPERVPGLPVEFIRQRMSLCQYRRRRFESQRQFCVVLEGHKFPGFLFCQDCL